MQLNTAQPNAARIDSMLFFIRLAKSRNIAQSWVAAGHIRINSGRIEKSSHRVHVDDIITLPLGDKVLAIRILSVPSHRGPASQSRLCYQILE